MQTTHDQYKQTYATDMNNIKQHNYALLPLDLINVNINATGSESRVPSLTSLAHCPPGPQRPERSAQRRALHGFGVRGPQC